MCCSCPSACGGPLGWFTLVVIVLVLGLYLLKLVRYPREVRAEFQHPIKMNFFPILGQALPDRQSRTAWRSHPRCPSSFGGGGCDNPIRIWHDHHVRVDPPRQVRSASPQPFVVHPRSRQRHHSHRRRQALQPGALLVLLQRRPVLVAGADVHCDEPHHLPQTDTAEADPYALHPLRAAG